jgi:hypothetical protein
MQVSDDSNLRGQGALVGFLVACTFVGAGLLSLRDHDEAVPIFLTDGIPTLVAGLIGGWLLAPRAARASTRRERLGVVLRLGVIAVIVGAIGMGVAMGAESWLRSRTDIGQLVLGVIVGGLMAAPIGLILFGWMLLPVTTLASGIWALVMAQLVRETPDHAGRGQAAD